MANEALTWHTAGTKKIESGVRKVALFVADTTKASGYRTGVAWNGVTGITENPGGADKTDLYADDEKYATLRGTETYAFGIEAYTYPDEWAECDGSAEVSTGVFLGQQNRSAFALAYETQVGDESHPGMDPAQRKLHLVWNCSASPSSRGYTTINDNPDAISFSWDADSTPIAVTAKDANGNPYKSCSCMTIARNSTNGDKFDLLEEYIYGKDDDSTANPPVTGKESTMLTPDQVINVMKSGSLTGSGNG